MSTDLGRASAVTDAPEGPCLGTVSLSYEDRLLRRRRLATADGDTLLVDLPETRSLNAGSALQLEAGHVTVTAAPEPLLRVTGDLARLAWHIGNRHTPCQVTPDALLIQADHVLAAMLTGLGAGVAEVTQPFTPEGGAYGHGRTLPHSHGPGEGEHHHHHHDHPHDHHHHAHD